MASLAIISPVAFFITLRETLEAGIIIVVLLGFIKQIVPPSAPYKLDDHSTSREALLSRSQTYQTFQDDSNAHDETTTESIDQDWINTNVAIAPPVVIPTLGADRVVDNVEDEAEVLSTIKMREGERESMVRTMKIQIWTGAISGLAMAMIIGFIFLWVLFTFARDLWVEAENLWEGTFCALASILILVMGLAFLRLPYAQTKWRFKLLSAYRSSNHEQDFLQHHRDQTSASRVGYHKHSRFKSFCKSLINNLYFPSRSDRSRFIFFGLPFITVLREGLEGVVFLGGISLSQTPLSVFLGAALGLIIGGLVAYVLFSSTSPLSMKRFTLISTSLLFLIGAGLASRSAYSLERQYFINGVGTAAAESGSGPGSYRVKGNLWKLAWGDPEIGNEGTSGWYQLANSLVGWNNIGTMWTVSIYITYWLIIISTLIRMKYAEGRTTILGHHSKRGNERERAKRRATGEEGDEEEGLLRPSREIGDDDGARVGTSVEM